MPRGRGRVTAAPHTLCLAPARHPTSPVFVKDQSEPVFLREAADQALMMGGSRDFPEVVDYQVFLDKLFTRLNPGRRERYQDEVANLRPLPAQRLDSVRRKRVRVSTGSLVSIGRNLYSVHSRLIGETAEARVHPDTVEIWYGDRKVEVLPRWRGSKHRIDYRHIIDWLVRRPGAFENYRYRTDLFPTSWMADTAA